MMTKNKVSLFFVFCLLLAGCKFSYKNIEYERAVSAVKSQEYSEALTHFERVIKKDPESKLANLAAREAARIALFDTKQFNLALNFLNHLVLYSPDAKERLGSQESIAFIFFDKLNDYRSAVKAYSRLLELPIEAKKVIGYRLNVAKSFYYLNQYSQALTEVENLLKQQLSSQSVFEISILKASIYITMKETEKAIEVYRGLMSTHPELSNREKVGVSIAFAYEDINEFAKAIEVLKEVRPTAEDQEFIDIKIKRLEQRMANLPGVRKRL